MLHVILAQQQAPGGGDPEAGLAVGVATLLGLACVALAAFLLYLLPVFVAYLRGHPDSGAIVVVTLFLGWSFVGWVVALAWACAAVRGGGRRRRDRGGGGGDFDFS